MEASFVTVLFTDLAGSAELFTRHDDDAADAIRRDHFAALRSAVAEYGGREMKPTGDGLMVAFDSAAAAVRCAIDMQRLTAASPDGVELRVGLDAVESIQEGQERGTPVLVARRLCNAAGPGEILASSVVGAIAGSLVSEVIEPVGEMALEGLRSPLAVTRLRWEPGPTPPAAAPGRAQPQTAGEGVEFRVLGPLEVRVNGRSVKIAGARQREMLVLFLLHAGEQISTDRLMDVLWGERQPISGVTALRVRVSQLRKALGAAGDLLVTRPSGYALMVERESIDLHRFEAELEAAERALAGGDPEAARDHARSALGLWRGPPLADLAYAPFAQAAIVRLEELHAAAEERRVDAELARGRHSGLVGELRTLVDQNPLRERLWAQLMIALYRAGRQADALATYRIVRARLVDEIGIEPGPELQQLEQRILAQDPALAAPSHVSDPPAQPTPLIGRPEELPSGLVTFVFTDIEGSTRMLQALESSYKDMLAAHNRVLRAAFSRHGGQEVKSMGDGFFFAFGDVGAAVTACIDAQRSLMAHRWHEAVELWVRIGLHAADSAPVRNDYVGVAVNQAARIMSAAHGGQTLVSSAVAQHVDDARLVALGLYRLKDFDDPIELYQVKDADLPSDFPALRALPAAAHNVPASRRWLVGRDADVAQVAQALETSRLVTMVGPGGVGKTSIAIELVRELASRYADGAWLVDLAPVTDEMAVADAVAATLGVIDAGSSALESLLAWLSTRRALIVLDNCEHLIAACAQLATAVLDADHAVSLLATSREPLNITRERVYRLDPLADSPATQLFLERAREARPEFTPEPDDVEATAAICRALDGLPLAIELAAAQVRMFSPAEVHAQLLQSALPPSTARDAPSRQRSFAHVMDWSYRLLADDERAVFRRCAVFAGGFTLEAVRSALGPADVLSELSSLYDKSLLHRADGVLETRFRMLEPVRQYCLELLGADERTETERNLANWALGFAERAGTGLTSVEQGVWLERCAEEQPNLIAALEWLRERGDGPKLAALAVGIAEYWNNRGSKREGIRWLLAAAEASADAQTTVVALKEAAKLAVMVDLDLGEEIANRAVATADRLGLASHAAGAWLVLARVACQRGDRSTGRAHHQTAIDVARAGGDPRELAYCLARAASHDLDTFDFDAARPRIAESGRLADRAGTPRLRGITLELRGRIAFEESRFADALPARLEALEVFKGIRDTWLTAWQQLCVGDTLTRLGEYERAAGHYRAALRICRSESLQAVEPWVWMCRSDLARYSGDGPQAVKHALTGLVLGVQTRGVVQYHLLSLAAALVMTGEHERAARIFGTAAGLAEETGFGIPLNEAADLEAAQADARAALGGRYDELYACGRAAIAVEDLEDLVRREKALVSIGQQP